MQSIDTRQASNQLQTLLNTLQEGNTIAVTQDNQALAILISPRDFQLLGGEEKLQQMRAAQMQENRQAFGQTLNTIRKEAQQNGLTPKILNDILNNA